MASPVEYQPCPLQFHEFRQLEVQKNCIKYYEVIQGQEITVDDLESLHAELMLLKEHVQTRIQTLTSESAVLNEWQVKRDYTSKRRRHSDVSDGLPIATAGNTGTASSKQNPLDQPPPKKAKVGGAAEERRASRGKKVKSTAATTAAAPVYTEQDVQPYTESAIRKPKPEGADRFWSSVEPYCSDITDTELKMLQEPGALSDASLFTVPSLGTHYSQQWAMEDINEEMARRNSSSDNMWQNETESLLKDAQSKTTQNGCGPLTQKLMSAFLDGSNGTNSTAQYRKLSSDIPTTTPTLLESRIKDELASLGLLDVNEQEKDHHEDDEILRELKKVQAELRTVCEYNQQQKQMLYSLARAEMRRQDIRKQLEEVDAEIMRFLQRFSSYRQRKKREPISRKEKEAAHRALDIRQKLTKQLLV